jgi:molybdopterin synthase sulfur carrier subunit
MRLRYFAWLKTRIGTGSEELPLPAGVTTVDGLVAWLRERGPGYAAALARPEAIRAAVNHEHASPDQAIADADEVALFPPVTGG